DVAIPKLRQGSDLPDWLLQRRKRAERALTTVEATCYLLGCPPEGWKNSSTLNIHTLVAVGVNTAGYREILGVDVTSAEDGAGGLNFFRGLVARDLSGVQLVTSDVHPGLVSAFGATL